MSSPENTQRRIANIHEATLLRGRGIDERDPLLVVDALLKEVREKGVHTVSGVVAVAAKDIEIAFIQRGVKEAQGGEDADATLKRLDMTDLLQSLRSFAGKSDEEMLAALKELKEQVSTHRKRA